MSRCSFMNGSATEGNRRKIAQVLDAVSLTESQTSAMPQEKSIFQAKAGIVNRSIGGHMEEVTEGDSTKNVASSSLEKGLNLSGKRKLTECAEIDESFQSSEDQEFVWEDYLTETGSLAAPPTLFIHVEQSLENGYKEGMMMEVPNSDVPGTYWVTSVITTCGPLLSLRYLGFKDDRSADFWWDATAAEVHPLGWCLQNGKQLSAPKVVQEKHENPFILLDGLNEAPTIPSYLLDVSGTTPIDFIKQGMKLEVQEEMNPQKVWFVTILENVGGRLLLRYDGLESASYDFWLFYLSVRLHLVGWGADNQRLYEPPYFLKDHHLDNEWHSVMEKAKTECFPMGPLCEIFQAQEFLLPHSFKVGMKLEALHPVNKYQICPATVSRVLSEYYFTVVIDDDMGKDARDETASVTMCCHSKCSTIFPVGWSKENGLLINPPEGYTQTFGTKAFDWGTYLDYCKATSAPKHLFELIADDRGFESGMKLEAVNPCHPNQVCAATISRVVPPLLWIQLDSVDASQSQFIVPFDSMDIFPVGWAESNSYPLKPPKQTLTKSSVRTRRSATSEKSKSAEKTKGGHKTDNAKAWCPRIYFNHMCFSGPFLSKRRLAELPQHVGPGSINLVMKEVLTMLINVAYKSSRVLRELQLQGKPRPNYQQQVLKAKSKGKSYRATVEIVRWADQVEEFCKNVCRKLECCPYLFGPTHVGNSCPEKCYSLTKTKFSQSFVKKQKKLAACSTTAGTNGAIQKPLPGRRKKRKQLQVLRNLGATTANQNKPTAISVEIKKESEVEISSKENDSVKTESDEVSSSTTTASSERMNFMSANSKKRPYLRIAPPKSGIVTRGAKIPNFSLEMKRQWKRREPSIRVTEIARQAVKRVVSQSAAPVTSTVEKKPLGKPAERPVSPTTPEVQVPVNGQVQETKPIEVLHLSSNPLKWSVDDVVQFIKGTECAPLARVLYEQEIDGQALLLLTLPTIQEFLELKLGPAIKFCHLIERAKLAFVLQFGK